MTSTQFKNKKYNKNQFIALNYVMTSFYIIDLLEHRHI